MKAVIRFFAVFIALLLIGAALFLVIINYNVIPGLAETVILPAWAEENVILVAAAGLLLIALILLASGFSPSKKPGSATLKSSEYGEVLISVSAVENMVLRIVQQTKGIKDVSRDVRFTSNGLVVNMKISAMPDVSLPDVIEELQAKTKEHLEEITGISVHEVKVLVDSVNMDQSASN